MQKSNKDNNLTSFGPRESKLILHDSLFSSFVGPAR